jgi:hypothetical protein
MIAGDNEIQSLVSFGYDDGFILIEYLETAPINRNKDGLIAGAPLLAFACKKSFDVGYEGYVLISIKWNERIIRYYEGLGAMVISKSRMVINPIDSKELVKVYSYKGE